MHYNALPFSMPYSANRCFDLWRQSVEATRAQRAMTGTPTSSVMGGMRSMKSMASLKSMSTSRSLVSRVLSGASSRKHSPTKTYSPSKKHSPSKTYSSTKNRSYGRTWDSVFRRTSMVDRGDTGAVVIGEQRGSKARVKEGAGGKEMIAELGYMEGIYETRVAAAERLLAFYVLFHAAVRPVSRLWGLSFDMDRSESRLRVASTPAPVPFVESMGAGGLEHDGAALSADPEDI